MKTCSQLEGYQHFDRKWCLYLRSVDQCRPETCGLPGQVNNLASLQNDIV